MYSAWAAATSPFANTANTVATLIDDAGLSARIGADHLGHAKVSMTQDRYMSRGRVHHQVADLLEQAVTDDSGS
jgi:hypothetical protein